MNILVLNCGSSSLKSCMYSFDQLPHVAIQPVWSGNIQWKGHFEDVVLEIERKKTKLNAHSFQEVLEFLFKNHSFHSIKAIGHRIVHGGKYYQKSVCIDADVKQKIQEFATFAPLHNPSALLGIEAMEQLFPNVLQIAVFDTAFHHTMPKTACIYPVPYEWYEAGIQRYGFHGISYQYCLKRSEELLKKKNLKTIICHLGAGASLCAIENGKSIDTTMGFTPLEGLMMNTRSGTIDPGILLEKLHDLSEEKLSDQLYRQSGLLGVSGLSSDMRDILSSQNPRAKLAFDLYIHRLSSHIGSMIASLGGLEALIFTAGIGENTPLLRQRVCERFAFLGTKIDPQLNEKTIGCDGSISHKDSKVHLLTIHTEEAFEIACECFRSF
jgi:acetate kinase